jgi:undecaprenyl-diphosphatase
MGRIINWLLLKERKLFRLVNKHKGDPVLDRLLGTVTHFGGAWTTIVTPLVLALLFPHWAHVCYQSMAALAASHVPVTLLKRIYPKLRPYQALPDTLTVKDPLTDHSFPSGHTTAVFSVILPFVHAMPSLGLILLPLALLTAYSRMYLGLHYPSDVAAGALLGTVAAEIMIYVM